MEHHIHARPEDIAPYVFVPGDHDRAQKIAAHFDNSRLVSESRGYRVFSGQVNGVPMTVCSTGMGGPQVAIAVEELAHLGARVLIRIGSCGTPQEHVRVGDVVIPSAVYRGGATANAYLPPAFPALPAWPVLDALVEAGQEQGGALHVGVISSDDAFYAGYEPALLEKLKQSGLLAFEMECDTLFVVAALRGLQAGAVLANDGTAGEVKPEWGREAFLRGEERAICTGIRAMQRIAAREQAEGG